MASQHVFLVQHEAFGLGSLKKHKTKKLGAGGEARNGLVAKIVDFVHPRTGNANCHKLLPSALGRRSEPWGIEACVRLVLCCTSGPSGPVECLEIGAQ